jgi:RNA polymerase sigma-B factor
VTEEETIEALGAASVYQSMSLDTPVTVDQDTAPLGDVDPGVETVVDRDALRPLLEQLPGRERAILMHRFYGNKTQTENAELLGLSPMHVSRLITKTLARLRHQLLQEA